MSSCKLKSCRNLIIVPCIVAVAVAILISSKNILNLTHALQTYIKQSNYDLQISAVDFHQGPKIIWLMSFPNSGNSFTTSLVRTYTNSITATNYGENHLNQEGLSQPIHSGQKYENGPFIVSPRYLSDSTVGKYVLTKTHCGGRCTRCAPVSYIETKESFKRDCLSARKSTDHFGNAQNVTLPYMRVNYDEKLVSKAIHIIRNPLDNVISRYHLFLKVLAKGRILLDDDLFQSNNAFTNDKEGFANWCEVQDNMYPDDEKQSFGELPFYELFQQIPCHADFYRYAQWHNHAFDIISDMSIPVMILYYEDFADDFNQSKEKLFQFIEVKELEKPKKSRGFKFNSVGKNYSSYYTEIQKEMIWKMLKTVCTKKSYAHISSRYYQHEEY